MSHLYPTSFSVADVIPEIGRYKPFISCVRNNKNQILLCIHSNLNDPIYSTREDEFSDIILDVESNVVYKNKKEYRGEDGYDLVMETLKYYDRNSANYGYRNFWPSGSQCKDDYVFHALSRLTDIVDHVISSRLSKL